MDKSKIILWIKLSGIITIALCVSIGLPIYSYNYQYHSIELTSSIQLTNRTKTCYYGNLTYTTDENNYCPSYIYIQNINSTRIIFHYVLIPVNYQLLCLIFIPATLYYVMTIAYYVFENPVFETGGEYCAGLWVFAGFILQMGLNYWAYYTLYKNVGNVGNVSNYIYMIFVILINIGAAVGMHFWIIASIIFSYQCKSIFNVISYLGIILGIILTIIPGCFSDKGFSIMLFTVAGYYYMLVIITDLLVHREDILLKNTEKIYH